MACDGDYRSEWDIRFQYDVEDDDMPRNVEIVEVGIALSAYYF